MPNPGQQKYLNAGPSEPEIADRIADQEAERDGKPPREQWQDPEKEPGGRSLSQIDVMRAMQANKALELRVQGKSYKEIAEKCGYKSADRASAAVQYLLRLAAREPARGVIRLELARLDSMLEAWWPFAVTQEIANEDGSTQLTMPDPQAAAIVLRLMERRDKLYGITGKDEKAPRERDAEETDETNKPTEQLSEPARVDRLAEILDSARARRNRPSAG